MFTMTRVPVCGTGCNLYLFIMMDLGVWSQVALVCCRQTGSTLLPKETTEAP